MSLSPGDRIDRYEILDLLGGGGMGEVYRARDPKLERNIALKILRDVDLRAGTDGGARLLREARAAAALSHPNVLAVYDVGEVQEPEALRGLAYIAMELVVGTSLRSYVGDVSVPLERRLGWMRDVARALVAAHDAGIVHRDVKPENVMIRFDGVVKVLDFGIARRSTPSRSEHAPVLHSVPTIQTRADVEATLTAQGGVAGTPLYMAPEQLWGQPLDGRADQFAWGVVAYELLTGAPPWRKDADPLALALEIISLTPRPPRAIAPSIPAPVSTTIVRALAKEPAARFSSMTALLESLDESSRTSTPAESSEPMRDAEVTTAPTALRAPAKKTKRHRSALVRSLVGVGVAGALAGLLVAARASSMRRPIVPSASSSSSPGASANVEECRTSAQCVEAHGGAWRCHSASRTCAPLDSIDCKVYAENGDLRNDDTVWIGGMFPLSTEPAFDSEMRALDLARREFAQVLGSSAARTGDMHVRPMGLVICDEGADPVRAARHLAEEVEVPAVVGFRGGKSALATIPPIFLPHHILSFISISQETDVTRIPQPRGEPRLVWRSTLNAANQHAPTSALISDVLEPIARSRDGGLGRRPMKVAIVSSKMGTAEVSASFRAIRFNGLTALENGENFKQFVLGPRGDGRDEEIADALADFQPQVIYVLPPDFTSRVLGSLEKRWHAGPRPFYIIGSTFDAAVLDLIGKDAERRHRFWAVTNVSSRTTNAELVLRYNIAFPREPTTRTTAPQPSYDAFYIIADALLALGDAPATGQALSFAIERLLPPGKPIDVGPASIFDAFETLRSGGRIDLNGAIGALDFDGSGEAPIDYAILCCGVDDRGRASGSVESGLVYDSRARKLTGALRCP